MSPDMNLMQLESFKFYALSSGVLALNLLVLAGMTGAARGKTKSFSNPEDGKGDAKAAPATDHPDVARVLRTHKNASENIPIFFAIGLIYVLSGASATGAKVYFITFAAARVLHSITQMKGLQPWRTIFYAIGSLCLVGMIVQIAIAAFK